jgi:addiction module HigA family antidote
MPSKIAVIAGAVGEARAEGRAMRSRSAVMQPLQREPHGPGRMAPERVAPEPSMIRIPTHREPTHPGEILLEEFLKPMALSQRDLAEGIHVPYQRVNELVKKRRGMTPGTALRLAKFFGVSCQHL